MSETPRSLGSFSLWNRGVIPVEGLHVFIEMISRLQRLQRAPPVDTFRWNHVRHLARTARKGLVPLPQFPAITRRGHTPRPRREPHNIFQKFLALLFF